MKTQKKYNWSVHYDIKGRKRYKAKLWFVFLLLIIVLLGCAALFYFGNTTWDPEAGFSPAADPKTPLQILFIVLGAVISTGAIVGTFFYCWFSIKHFYNGQAEYFKTKIFKDHKARALKGDLTKLNKKTLKWYKKLGYLNSDEFHEVLEAKKNKNNEKTTKN